MSSDDNRLFPVYDFLTARYSLDELRELSFELGVEYENLGGGDTRRGKARALLLALGEQGRLEALLEALARTRTRAFAAADLPTDAQAVAALYTDLDAFGAATRPLHERLLTRIGLDQRVGFVLLALVVIASVLLLYLALRPAAETLLPPLDGDFNVAVAKFGEVNRQGEVVKSRAGETLAGELYAEVDAALDALRNAGFDVPARPPADTGWITGESVDEQAEKVAAAADNIGADLLIYGNLVISERETRLVPQIYVSNRRFRNAAELEGHHNFGGAVSVAGDISQNPAASKVLGDQLAARTRALAAFAIGLGYYALDRFDDAGQHLAAAADLAVVEDEAGQSNQVLPVLHLFQGSTAAQQGDWPAANQAYTAALDANPGYARAQIGQAQMEFLQARGNCEPGATGVDGIHRAIEGYTAALRTGAPAHARVPAKVALGLGHAYACLSQAQAGDFWQQAEDEYRLVVSSYENGGADATLAAEAQAGLGFVALPFTGDPDPDAAYRRALEAYAAAAALSPHADRQAVFYLQAARIQTQLGACEQAETALAEANAAIAAFDQTAGAERDELAAFREDVQSHWQSLCQG